MKKKKSFLLAGLSVLALSALGGCGSKQPVKSQPTIEDEEQGPLEIGDTVREWCSTDDFEKLPMGVSNRAGKGEITEEFGNDDDCSLSYELTANGYLSTADVEEEYFKELDAKNGDIISLYFYLPEDHNIKTLKLEAMPANSRSSSVSAETINVDSDMEGKWIRTMLSYDTLDMLGSIRLNYTLENSTLGAKLYVDDINITLGEETVKTAYEANDESLWKTYEDQFRVGTCMSGSQIRNSEFRKLTVDNFNSITAENEGKPEQILDQSACQALLSGDDAGVAITTKPFEKIYDWAEANHIGVRHHTFVWYSQTPAWFFTKDYTQNGQKADRDLMLRRMENYIRTTLETINDRWPGLVYAVDVANEAVENGHIRNTNNNWYTTVGDDFVYYAFKFAHEYKAEDQELYYNDFSFDYQTSNCSFALNNVLKQAIEEELIDGVGIQGHLDSNANMDNIITDAKMIKEKGLKCQLTELDITINGNNENNLNQQKQAYKNLTKKMLENNAQGLTEFNAFIVWGLTDNTSWKSNQYPLLFNNDYSKKPCYYGILEAASEANI